MKSVKYSALLVLVVMSLSFAVLAKDKNEAKFTLTQTAQLGSTQLKPGDYKASWDGTGADVQVKILQGKSNVVATSPAKVVDLPTGMDAVTFGGTSSVKTLDEIDFGHLHKALVFSPATTASK